MYTDGLWVCIYFSEHIFLVRLFQIHPDSGELISIQPFCSLLVTVTLVPALITFPVLLRPDVERKLDELTTTIQLSFSGV